MQWPPLFAAQFLFLPFMSQHTICSLVSQVKNAAWWENLWIDWLIFYLTLLLHSKSADGKGVSPTVNATHTF
jgi:hypothetical protein